jgi:phenylacetate-CoA ligase
VTYLDTVALTPGSVDAFMTQIRREKTRVLFGHAHSLFVVAQICRNGGIPPPEPMVAIVSTSMMLLDNERRFIESYFNCPVTDRYGCEEVGLIAAECSQHRGLHVNDDHLVVEIVGAHREASEEAGVGEIVVTDLNNFGMPLIRYAVGDMSSWQSGACPCGRSMPRLARVFGRTADFLRGQNGALVAGVSLVERTLTAISGLEQIQIVQHSILKATVRCVLSPDADRAVVSRQLRTALQSALGRDLEVGIDVVPQLTQDRNGKYRFSVREF